MPIGKHLAGDGPICGQVRLVVNPETFMRASAVRFYVYSADATYHKSRVAFHEELFEVLNPILGTVGARENAARGIYGGKLPEWYKDMISVELLKQEARVRVAEEAREAVQEEAEARQLDEENKPKLAKKVSEPVCWKEVEQNTKLAASKAETKGERAFSGASNSLGASAELASDREDPKWLEISCWS